MLFLPQLTPAKKKQLTYLLLLSVGLVVVIWIFWVTKFGYNRQTQTGNEFFNTFRQRSQDTVNQYNNLKDQLQATWQQVENTVTQSQKQEEIIDQMKERITTNTPSSTTSTEVQVESTTEQTE